MERYFIISNDHINDKKNILHYNYSHSKYDALEIIQEYAEAFIKNIEGNEPIIYYNPNENNRKFGYFIMKDFNDINSLTAYRKYKIKGYIYNSVKIDKIITFTLVKIYDDTLDRDFYNIYELFSLKEEKRKYIDYLKNIFEKISEDANLKNIFENLS